MQQDRHMNSKTLRFFDWLWRLFVFNVLTMITSLGIVIIHPHVITISIAGLALMPSLVACMQSIKDFSDSENDQQNKDFNIKDFNIFKTYFINYAKHFKRAFLTGVFIVIVIGIFSYAIYFYYQSFMATQEIGDISQTFEIFTYIGLLFMILCTVILILVVNQLLLVFTYFYFRFFDNFRFAFFMVFKFFTKNFKIMLIMLASGLMFIFITPTWYFAGISFPLFFIYKVSNPVYLRMINKKDENHHQNIE